MENNHKKLAEKIRRSKENKPVVTKLETSERVLKRVTDGIYRQPASALRELISNAYDADATKVEITTDRPRFNQITVHDNGRGMDADTLAFLIRNIGGSAKRTNAAKDLNICKSNDISKSPKGRPLIGKIGIGLFAVAQLTKSFKIITKKKGDDHRVVAHIVMHTYSEEKSQSEDENYDAGEVHIWNIPAFDTEAHGTEIILESPLRQTKEHLQSRDRWMACNPSKYPEINEVQVKPRPAPKYHIGCVFEDRPDEISESPCLPWDSSDSPSGKFKKLIDEIAGLVTIKKKPTVSEYLDYYFEMIWTLSLAVPLPYTDAHPFDIGPRKDCYFYELGNSRKLQAKEIKLKKDETLRSRYKLIAPARKTRDTFNVIIDGIQLSRPIKYQGLPKTLAKQPYSLLFVGKDAPDLSSIPQEFRGGSLKFEAALIWNHTIVPKDHIGVMLRIHDASSGVFDDSFMDYPVSELTRMNQVTAEIFVTSGLEPALNIDRESFNYAHPHYQYIRNWLHNAFRQLSNRHKDVQKKHRDEHREKEESRKANELEEFTEKRLQDLPLGEEAAETEIEIVSTSDEADAKREAGVVAYEKQKISKNAKSAPKDKTVEALVKILTAHGVFEEMSYDQQQQLISDILAIFSRI